MPPRRPRLSTHFARLLLAAAAVAAPTASAAPPIVPGIDARDSLPPDHARDVLLTELSCTACHGAGQTLPPKRGPDLSQVAARAKLPYLTAFIADPGATKPGTTMPHLLHGLDDSERAAAAAAITAYLASLTDERPDDIPPGQRSAKRGRDLFHTVGCAACHSPEDTELQGSPPLHRLTDKYTAASLTQFLEAPLESRPSGRMPDLKLDHFEARDLAAYLLREPAADSPPPEAKAAPGQIAEGRELFTRHRCYQCHDTGEKVEAPAEAPALADLDLAKPCTTARFDLAPDQRAAIAAAPAAPSRSHTLLTSMLRMNCVACHTAGDFSAPSPERNPHFTTTNINLGEQARIPPRLDLGRKLKPDWRRKVVVTGASSRPYMNTRMPAFGAPPEIESLLATALEPPADPLPEPPPRGEQKSARDAGLLLVGDKNLSCVACHTWKGESATTLHGIELTSMTDRLREDWFHAYMLNPSEFHPGTIMPNFWPGGNAVRPELLGGDPAQQIDAIWQYLERGREARSPSGIRREPLFYGPGDDGRAVVLRRQYRGIGKRGIGVGYPGGINIAFDALQLRLGSVWAGDFGEMSGVWRGQGSGVVNEGSREVSRLQTGPDIARLPAPGSPWPALPEQTRPEGYQFEGYTLDKAGRPAFRYRVGDLGVTDYLTDDGPKLTRTLTFAAPAPDGLYLRIGSTETAPAGDGDSYALDRGLRVGAPPATYLFEGRELRLPLAGETEITLHYWFEPK